MQCSILALDYDGTIAQDGVLDPEVRQAVREVRAHGMTVVIVTGRILDDLRRIMGDLRVVDAVVAENGAVLAFPASGRSVVLAPQASERLLAELRRRGLEAQAGACVIETAADHAGDVLDAVRTLELPLVLLFNRGQLMVLPQAVSKATGLREALSVLRLSTHNAIGIGDGENDHELLAVCEIGVAVAWGTAALLAAADVVIEGTGPQAVAAYSRCIARARRQPTGLPHGILVDEAHYFLHGPRVEEMVDLDMGGYTLVTYRASSLEASVRRAAEAIVVTRTTDQREATALAQLCGAGEVGDWQRRLATLTIGEAALLPTIAEAGGRLRRVRLAARLTDHIRHRQKYLDVPVPAHLAFYFSGIGMPAGRYARTLTEFINLLVQAPREALDSHLHRHDFSRWIGDVYGDRPLAAEIHLLEDAYAQGRRHDIHDALAQIIRDRYEGFTEGDET
jgi:hydroxymethylpyrimidine pyrophosphatase-like HAD family hydrolase